MNKFTPGQVDRMYYVWSIYRKGRESYSTGNTRFEFEILTDSWSEDIQWSLRSTDGKIKWDTFPENGVIPINYGVPHKHYDDTRNLH